MEEVPHRKLSNSEVTEEQREGIQMAYEQLLKYCEKIQNDQGMTRLSYFIGVWNLILTIIVFIGYPPYYWLVFIYKIFIIIPARLYIGISRKDNFYLADFCWVSVFFDSLVFVLFIFEILPTDYEVILMRVIFLFSNGPQGWAAVLFSNAMVFHSFMHQCSVFIHISPVLATYVIKWNYEQIMEIWPNLFPEKNIIYMSQYGDMRSCFWPAFGIYMVWWIVYVVWMCISGINLPKKGHDTVFNWIYTSNQGVKKQIDLIAYKLFKKQKDMQTKTKIAIYMVFHMTMVVLTMQAAILCFEYQIVHTIFIIFIGCSVLWQSSGFYIYFTLNGPKRHLEKTFQKQIIPTVMKWEKKKKNQLKKLEQNQEKKIEEVAKNLNLIKNDKKDKKTK